MAIGKSSRGPEIIGGPRTPKAPGIETKLKCLRAKAGENYDMAFKIQDYLNGAPLTARPDSERPNPPGYFSRLHVEADDIALILEETERLLVAILEEIG